MQLTRITLVLAMAGILSACQSVSTTKGGAVGANRSQNMSALVSSAELEAQANQSYQQLVRDAQARGLLNRDPSQAARVRAIANRLIPQTKVFRDDLGSWKWEVNVLTKNELNAWCMPGGKIMFYSGIIEQLQLTDDEIAAIMGHEMAHALREHSRERASDAATQNLLFSGVSILTGGKYDNAIGVAQEGTKYLWTLPNSREHEAEADRMGVELAARAGYNPQAAVNVWRKMQAKNGGGTPEFMSTHPSAESRIADLTAQIAKVQPLYQAALAEQKTKPVQKTTSTKNKAK
ncbi:M48 family metallopeptidase [Chitinilyticum piscinae]|uniref:M48 family metallopeptidase n=1 Tax=Chitinilyticum piscinae TaxID=2866724 RepID=A0A8J7FJY7_9NEIS|nr:M48 family metallopeptidase [Chitinilyticum piscinae]MBE9608129.1 M48 family metallopeptidase [Chitinilyticum piscinae]